MPITAAQLPVDSATMKGYAKVAVIRIRYTSPYRRNKLDKKDLTKAVEKTVFESITILQISSVSCSSVHGAKSMVKRI